MARFFAQIEYQGTRYHGFQKQKNSKSTIQAKVELALSKGKKNYDKRESKKKKSWEREKRKIK